MSNDNSVLGLLAGTAIGAALGILFAPDKGSVTRQRIIDEAEAARESLTENAYELKDRVATTVMAKKATLDEQVDKLVTNARYKADDVITTLERKLEELKARNKRLQKDDTKVPVKTNNTVTTKTTPKTV